KDSAMRIGTRVWNALRTAALRASAWPFRVAASRAAMRALAGMDGRELADIGLTRSDLRDASALALDSDPTALLAWRARGRRREGARASRGDDGRRAGPQTGAARPGPTGTREMTAR